MKKSLDKAFKDKLEHGTASYPEDLWDKIEAQLPQEENAPSSFLGNFGILGSLLLLLLFSFGLYYFTKADTNTDQSIETSISEVQTEANQTQNSKRPNTRANISQSEILSSTDLDDKIEINQDKGEILISNDENQTSANSNTVLGNNRIIGYTNNSTSSERNLIPREENQFNSSVVNQLANVDRNDAVQQQEKRFTQDYAVGSSEFISSDGANNILLNKGDTNSEAAKPASKSLAELEGKARSVDNTSNANAFLARLESRKIESVQYLKSNRRRYNAKKLLTECPAFIITGGKGIILDFYFSPDYAMREFNPRDIEFIQYSAERASTENPFLSFSAGMRFSYVNKSGLALRTGINFTQINENFQYLNTNVTGVDTIIKIQDGTNVRDTTFVEIGETVELSTHNRYRSVDVPMLIGLEMPFNRKVKLSLNAGVFVNLLFQQRGRFIDQQGHPNWFVGQNVYKTSLGLSYYGSLGVNYFINPRMDFMLEPNLRYYSQSFTVNNYPLTQEYLKFGVLTGIRYHF